MVWGMENQRAPVLLTSDPQLRDAVLAAAAAAGTTATAVSDPEQIPHLQTLDQPLVIGIDRVRHIAHHTLPPSSSTCLVGTEEDRDDLCAWSAPLGASVVVLPDGFHWLTGLLAGDRAEGSGRVIGVIGGHGGAGASTLAVSLAQSIGGSVALVDLDERGGGLDLLLGAERTQGWRWPDLASSSGYIDDLAEFLPSVHGVPVLSMARAEDGPGDPSPEAVAAVLRSLAREHELVIVDLGRSLSAGARQGLRHCHVRIVVTGGCVRQVAAAEQIIAEVCDRAGLVVRRGTEGASAQAVADTLGLPLWGEIPDEPRLVAATERGEPLGDVTRRWQRSCGRVLAQVTA